MLKNGVQWIHAVLPF